MSTVLCTVLAAMAASVSHSECCSIQNVSPIQIIRQEICRVPEIIARPEAIGAIEGIPSIDRPGRLADAIGGRPCMIASSIITIPCGDLGIPAIRAA